MTVTRDVRPAATTFEVNDRSYVHDGTPVVVICVDGSGPAYHEAAIAGGRMPWLQRMLHERGSSLTAACAMPALTNPNNLSIATGRPPAVHGISGNFFLDPVTGDETLMNDPRYLRAPTIFAKAHDAGLDVAVVTAKDKLRRLLGQGLDPARCFSAEHADAEWQARVGMSAPSVYSANLSEFVLAAGEALLDDGVDLLYLSLSDFVQHKHAPGTPEADDFYAMLDRHAACLDATGAVVVLTADHGMSAKSHPDGSPRVLFLHDELDQIAPGSRVVLPITDPYVVHHGALGSIAYVYVADGIDHDQTARRIRALPGIDAAFGRADAERELQLPADRIGDIVVVADAHTALGHSPGRHDLTGLDAPLRSHGGFGEQAVPFLVNRRLPDLGPVHNYDAFVVGTTITSSLAAQEQT